MYGDVYVVSEPSKMGHFSPRADGGKTERGQARAPLHFSVACSMMQMKLV